MKNSRVNVGGPSWAVGVGRSHRMTEMQSVREREGEMSAEKVRDEQIYSIKVERKRDGQPGGREVESVKCVGIVVSKQGVHSSSSV